MTSIAKSGSNATNAPWRSRPLKTDPAPDSQHGSGQNPAPRGHTTTSIRPWKPPFQKPPVSDIILVGRTVREHLANMNCCDTLTGAGVDGEIPATNNENEPADGQATMSLVQLAACSNNGFLSSPVFARKKLCDTANSAVSSFIQAAISL